jgi:TPR repeat protein
MRELLVTLVNRNRYFVALLLRCFFLSLFIYCCVFSAVVTGHPYDEERLLAAARLGDAFSKCWLVRLKEVNKNNFAWAEEAAAAGERDAFYLLGQCYQIGRGVQRDLKKAKNNFAIAAELGSVPAMRGLALLLPKSSPVRVLWMARAARLGGLFFIGQLKTVLSVSFSTNQIRSELRAFAGNSAHSDCP